MTIVPPTAPAMPSRSVADIDAATRRLMAALDALEGAVERRHDADRDEDELAARIQALGADRSRLADELDGSLVEPRRLERANREIAERLDAAIGTIRVRARAGEAAVSHINVTINGRQYRMACEEGQEERLLKLAESFEARIDELRGKFGEIGDARLTVMAAMTASTNCSTPPAHRQLGDESRAARRRVAAADRAATQNAVAAALNAAPSGSRRSRECSDHRTAARRTIG